jgi:hypothetical protein
VKIEWFKNGKLMFDENTVAEVTYALDLQNKRGRVAHAEGHPNWHPIVSLQTQPSTLVLEDGRKLEVILKDEHGSVELVGDFF